jgi:putative CRISPR-associated protein (TIGR02619 family)
MPRLVISTVGTSLLTNQIDRQFEEDWYTRLRDTANYTAQEVERYHDDIFSIIEKLKKKAEEKLNGDSEEIREACAELNGIYGLYDNQLDKGKQDIHYLVASDTAQDQVTAEMLQTFLRTMGFVVEILNPKGFCTRSTEVFKEGIDEILDRLDAIVVDYKKDGYQICFNLVGGFKAIQGFMNTFGMFYADEILYIFEGNQEIIKIPKLPIKIDDSVIKPVEFALMEAGAEVNSSKIQNIPETLLFVVDKQATLSNWGKLIWNRCKEKFLSDKLLPFPQLKYESSFIKDYQRQKETKEKLKLQETLAKVSHLLIKHNGDTAPLKDDGGILYEVYQNKRGIAHFRITQGIRVSCVASEGSLILRRYGKEPDVNKDP